jgi:hypothetical protein
LPPHRVVRHHVGGPSPPSPPRCGWFVTQRRRLRACAFGLAPLAFRALGPLGLWALALLCLGLLPLRPSGLRPGALGLGLPVFWALGSCCCSWGWCFVDVWVVSRRLCVWGGVCGVVGC